MKKEKKPRWQKEQEKRKKNKARKAFHYFLIIAFLAVFLSISWRAYRVLKNSTWDGRSRLTLLLNVDPVSLASFDYGTGTINLLVIPDGTYIEAADDRGPYRIEKIYSLGELEEKGIELLSASLETYFGLPVDGWIMAEEEWEETSTKSFLSKLIVLATKKKDLTSLSHWDLFRLWLMISRTRTHKFEVVNLKETTVAEEFDLPDGSRARRVDNQRLERIISNLFTDYQIRQEDLAIAIMNAGTETGLAAKAANLVSNIGGRLVEVGDWPEELASCQIKTTSSVKKSYTGKKLSTVFNCQYKTDLKENRWDLLIILTGDNW